MCAALTRVKPPLLEFDQALNSLVAQAQVVDGTQVVSTLEACGRVLAEDVRSAINVPPMDNTQMDGYAVRTADFKVGSGTRLRVAQRIPAGQVGVALQPGTVARIFTGAMIPPGADAVVMQESTRIEGDEVVIDTPPQIGDWVRQTGEDIACGEVILPAGTRLNAQACGLAASVGLAQLTVCRPLRVTCFFTGDELTMPGEPLRPGAIYNSNRFVLVNLLRGLGCEVTDFGIVPDSLTATRDALRRAAAGSDLILTSGGVSVGDEDHVKPAVQAEGELQLWQIAMKPGKPLAYGKVRADGQHAHFIGLPGNPVSSFVTFLMLVRPFLLRLQGAAQLEPMALPMRADFDWLKPDRRREFLRVSVNKAGGLGLYLNQSSAVLSSTVHAQGLLDNPAGQLIRRGDCVRFLPFAGLLS
jgi:molybdopterin molybdotransferase